MKREMLLISAILVIISCKKKDDTDSASKNFTPQPEAKFTNAVFISYFERLSSTKYLTVFEPNGTVRWNKAGRGNPVDGYTAYGNGMIYSIEPGATTSISNLYAYDINTGAEKWTIPNSTETKYYPVVRNDTLFCSTSFSSSSLGNITAFNALTGAFLWRKQLPYSYWPLFLKLDGNTLFFIAYISSTDAKLVSFNITTRTVNWESASLGINLASTTSKIAVSGSRVAVKTGTKLLMVFDRATGAIVWTKPGIPFEPPVILGNKLFTFCRNETFYPPAHDSLMGVYAFDVNTGVQAWKWKKNIEFSNTNPFASGNMIFHSGILKDGTGLPEKGYLKGFDIENGNEVWTVTTDINYDNILQHIACVGNRVYAFKYPSGLPGSNARIVAYDYSNGQVKDSIAFVGESFGKMYLVASDGKAYTPE